MKTIPRKKNARRKAAAPARRPRPAQARKKRAAPVARAVARPDEVVSSPTPVGVPSQMTAPQPAAGERGLTIRRILVPIDFSAHSKNALKYAVPLAEQFSASLHLVFVVEPTIYPADLGFGQVVLPGVEDELRQKAADELHALIEREIGARVVATATVRTGSPHQEILDEADDQHVDLIVVASHGHSGVEQILFGSTADRIVHHARCPVMTVRPSEE